MLKAKLENAEELNQESGDEHIGGERFNRLLGLAIAIAVIGGTVLALGVERSGVNQSGAAQKLIDDPNAEWRDRGESPDLAADRLQFLSGLALATRVDDYSWQLDEKHESTLRDKQRSQDVIKSRAHDRQRGVGRDRDRTRERKGQSHG